MKVMHLSELKKGMKFPTYQYTLRADIIKTYLAAVEELNALYADEDPDAHAFFGHPIVPPTTIAVYVTPSRVLQAIEKKPPNGMIQTGQRFEFYHPILIGETVTVNASIEDLYQKKGRDYVVLKGEAVNEQGQRAAVSYLTFIWPSQP
jgi:acyl dehydratase